jgi:hypothetical protein
MRRARSTRKENLLWRGTTIRPPYLFEVCICYSFLKYASVAANNTFSAVLLLCNSLEQYFMAIQV